MTEGKGRHRLISVPFHTRRIARFFSGIIVEEERKCIPFPALFPLVAWGRLWWNTTALGNVLFIFALGTEYPIFSQIPTVPCKTCWKERTRKAVCSTGGCRLHISSKRKEEIHIDKTKQGEVSWTRDSNQNVWLIGKKTKSVLFHLFYFHINPRGRGFLELHWF